MRDGEPGHSDSLGKLRCIGLPNDLSNKSVLDIGCNEGFFCGEALRRGATRVVGIEMVPDLAASARKFNPGAEILNQTWDELPNEKFDVIMMLSALHYEPRPRDLMDRIHERLAPGGLFILECGVHMSPGYTWTQVVRAVGVVSYPTETLLREHILYNFATRMTARSVNQAGDTMPRFVFHCTQRVTTYILAGGQSGSGKTNLAYSLAAKGVVTVIVDMLVINQLQSKRQMSDVVLARYFEKLGSAGEIGAWIDAIKDRDAASRLARFVFSALPREPDIVFVEGYFFENAILVQELVALIKQAGLRAWIANRAV